MPSIRWARKLTHRSTTEAGASVRTVSRCILRRVGSAPLGNLLTVFMELPKRVRRGRKVVKLRFG